MRLWDIPRSRRKEEHALVSGIDNLLWKIIQTHISCNANSVVYCCLNLIDGWQTSFTDAIWRSRIIIMWARLKGCPESNSTHWLATTFAPSFAKKHCVPANSLEIEKSADISRHLAHRQRFTYWRRGQNWAGQVGHLRWLIFHRVSGH